MMKKIMLLLVFLVFVSSSYAAIDVSYKCHEEHCLEGTLIDYSVVVYNNLNFTVYVDDVYLRDTEANKIFAFDVREMVSIESRESFIFNFSSDVKAPESGFTFYYKPCFEAKKKIKEGQFLVEEVCDDIVRSLTVLPLDKRECEEDSDCLGSEYCNDYICVMLACGKGQIAKSHGCLTANCNFLQSVGKEDCVYSTAKVASVLILLGVLLLLIYFYKKK